MQHTPDKLNPDGSGTGRLLSAEANEVKLISVFKENLQQFWKPVFYSSGGTLHGNELNEYGLLAAPVITIGHLEHTFLEQMLILMNLNHRSKHSYCSADGTVWLDSATKWGIFQYNTPQI